MASFAGHLNLYIRNDDVSGGHRGGYLLSYPTVPPCVKDTRCAPDQKRDQIAAEPAVTPAASRDGSPEQGTWLHPQKTRLPELHTSGKFPRDLSGKPPP